jgi:hypothetical protein
MQPISMELPDRLQKQVDMGESGTDILHGELKNLMYEAEQELYNLSELQDQPTYKYWEGQLDGLTHVYGLTYALAFAIDERTKKNG